MKERHRCKKHKLVVDKTASSLSVIGCYAFTQNPERFDANKSVAETRLNTKKEAADQEALFKIDSKSFQNSRLGRDGAPNRASELKRKPCFVIAFALQSDMKVMIHGLPFGATVSPFHPHSQSMILSHRRPNRIR